MGVEFVGFKQRTCDVVNSNVGGGAHEDAKAWVSVRRLQLYCYCADAPAAAAVVLLLLLLLRRTPGN